MKTSIILNIYYEPVDMLKDYIRHNKNLYVPINCGNLAIPTKSEFASKHIHFEDEMKDNISHLNPKLNEMTAIYAFWKNLMKDEDYVGFNHYRRLFQQSDLLDLDKYDVIDAKPIPMIFNLSYFTGAKSPQWTSTSIEGGYEICHIKEDWDKMVELLKQRPEYYLYFDNWNNQNSLTSPCNMFVMKRKLFEEYCEFIFPILFELERQIDLTGRSDY